MEPQPLQLYISKLLKSDSFFPIAVKIWLIRSLFTTFRDASSSLTVVFQQLKLSSGNVVFLIGDLLTILTFKSSDDL